MPENTKDYFCLDCKKLIDQPIPGVLSGSLRTDGDRSVKKAVPGGIVYGNELGYVCDDCSIFGGKKCDIQFSH